MINNSIICQLPFFTVCVDNKTWYINKPTTSTHKDVILYVVFDKKRYSTYCSGGELLCNTRNPFRNYELKRVIYTNNYTTIYTTIYAVAEVCAGLYSLHSTAWLTLHPKPYSRPGSMPM